MIASLLDNDLYKFTMQQAVLHQFPNVNVEYTFKIRNYPYSILTKRIFERKVENQKRRSALELIQDEVDRMPLGFADFELDYLRSLPYITDDYIAFLRGFKLNPNYVKITPNGITIAGPWLQTILFEVPVLAIISEVFSMSRKLPLQDSTPILNKKLDRKIRFLKKTKLKFSDFGGRRRFWVLWHHRLVTRLAHELPEQFIGTSNVMLAKLNNVKPIGTMAHEWVQAMQAIVHPRYSQQFALQAWAEEYRGQLGIALSDTVGIDAFLRDFDGYFARLYDGVRQDSGIPHETATKIIRHYRRLGIEPATKTIVFSDGLTPEKAKRLHDTFSPIINCVFGIGTNLTNDAGFEAPQIVIKMTRCNGQPVAKISDSEGKEMCTDLDYLKYLANIFKTDTPNCTWSTNSKGPTNYDYDYFGKYNETPSFLGEPTDGIRPLPKSKRYKQSSKQRKL